MNPSSPNHHRQTTSLVTGAALPALYRSSNTLEHQEIRSRYPAAYRVVDIEVDNQTRTALTRDPKPSATPPQHPAVTMRTNLSQVGFELIAVAAK
jgi:hypothetical protein